MAGRNARLESCRIARAQRVAAILDQHRFAFENENELVFVLAPVAVRGGGARLQPRQIDAELREPRRLAELLFDRPFRMTAYSGG